MTFNKTTGLADCAKLPVGDLSKGGNSMPIRRALVIHYTEGGAAKTSWGWWTQPQNRKQDLGAHFLIERDGTVYQCRACNRTISHAGRSRWADPKTGKMYYGLNSCSIGIELCNTGDACDDIRGEEQLRGFAGYVQATHRNSSQTKKWEKFSDAQFQACLELSKLLVSAYNLDDVTGHDCIAPERKIDPGPAFPIEKLREALGFKGLPAVHRP